MSDRDVRPRNRGTPMYDSAGRVRYGTPSVHRERAEWNRARIGSGAKGASLTRLGQHTYRAELGERLGPGAFGLPSED